MSNVSAHTSKLMAKMLNEESALIFLSIMVVEGKESFDLDGLSWHPSDCTLELFSKVKDDKFFQPFFVTSMKMALVDIFKSEQKTTTDLTGVAKMALDKFSARLKEIFPAYFAERLFQFACSKLQESKKWLFCSKEELWERQKYAQGVFDKSIIREGLPQQCPSGTGTWLVSCPQCKLKKRCDMKTKNFRCKCGFEKPYPFA